MGERMGDFIYPLTVINNMAKSLTADVNNYQDHRQEIEDLKIVHNEYINRKEYLENILENERKRCEILTEHEETLHKKVNQRRAALEKEMKDSGLLADNLEKHLLYVREAISKYMENLDIHLHINSVVDRVYQVQVSLFTDKKADNYYLVTEWNKQTNKFKLLEMKPQPKEFFELCKTLEESNEMHQLLYWIRQYFKYCIESGWKPIT